MPALEDLEVFEAFRQLPDCRHALVFIQASMIVAVEECASPARSAQAILGKGDGERPGMLEALRCRRPSRLLVPEGTRS